MVWFQCEDCGDNLKKPKLPNHFNICSASKLSCIDCGEIFGQQSVLGHTQCITETEKYGPKGQAKPLNGSTAKTKDPKQQTDFDINVGLSDRPPWFCSLCNTKATSKQALLLHAEGKKHKGKARAIHAANQRQKQTEESGQDAKSQSEIPPNGKLIDERCVEEHKELDPAKAESGTNGSKTDNGNLESKKRRKSDEFNDASLKKKIKKASSVGPGNGEVIQVEKAEGRKKETRLKQDEASKSHSANGESKEKIKWKKLITSALKSSPEGVLKMKKLRKHVLKVLQESGITSDEDQLRNTLESKIDSSSRFEVENKYVRLVAKN